ncbi:LPXTG cell wall anchor domain-containing protein [uncultured Microbacterium sp.]|uniref:DUF7507 domain-containing protein n=1 Tax=uncultured Microbacterium sp. TaxID=191216 RepID=UPI0025F7D84B|nr:LPXTG cell wall anchor domain-containing protein [uncultured Microbacterium sp.]
MFGTQRSWRMWATGLLTSLLLILGALVVAPAASAATNTSCSTATPGSGRYASTLCWFDFSGYDPAQASSAAGQAMVVSLPGGSTLAFTVKASGGPATSSSFPTYSAAYLGNGSYTGVSGRPAFYQSQPGTTTDLSLSDIAFRTPTGDRSTAFSLVGADAESTDTNESITWRSDNPIYSLTAQGADPGIGNACNGGFTGVGTQQVTCTARSSSTKTGTAILASRAPATFTQRMVGGGRQAVAFGVLISRVELAKTVASRFTGDAFALSIKDANGTGLYSAATGPMGTSATTGAQSVIATDGGASFQFAEAATSGSLSRYDISWSCTRNGQSDPTLPLGRGVGSAATVQVGIGDFVSCTITNTAKPTTLLLRKHAGTVDDVNGNGLADAGDRIPYTFDVTNTGDLPMSGVAVNDPKVGAVTCPAGELAPGATVTCTGDAPYTATLADQSAGSVDNTATATGNPTGTSDTVTSNPSSTSTPLTAPSPEITLVKVGTPNDAASFVVGQVISYSFVVTNTGNVPVRDIAVTETAFTGTGTAPVIDCPDTSTTALAVRTSLTCTASYTITQADVDALPQPIRNTATASGDPVGGGAQLVTPPATVEIPGDAHPALGLQKSVTPDVAHVAGDRVDYTFHVTNLGNVTLSDPRIRETTFSGTGGIPAATCPAGPLAPGASVDCTASYLLTQADIDAAAVDNTAVATADSPSDGPVDSPSSSAAVRIPQEAGLALVKSSPDTSYSATAQTITYRFAITNTGNVSISGITVTEDEFSGAGRIGAVDCPRSTLDGGASMTCSAVYSVQQGDLDAGSLFNRATAHGTPAGGSDPIDTAPSDVTIPAVQASTLHLDKTADPVEASSGESIEYRFRITNSGNVSVVRPQVVETTFSGSGALSGIVCLEEMLAPGASADCVGYYTVTDEDRSAEVVNNTAYATATPPTGVTPPRSNDSSATVTVRNPVLALVKAADTDRITRIGQTIHYTFTLRNTGNVELVAPRVVEVSFTGHGTLGAAACPADARIAPGGSIVCTADYAVVAADLTGADLRNTAASTAETTTGVAVTSNESRVDIPTVAPPAVTAPGGDDLPTTGGQFSVAAVIAAIALIVVGAGALVISRRRRQQE